MSGAAWVVGGDKGANRNGPGPLCPTGPRPRRGLCRGRGRAFARPGGSDGDRMGGRDVLGGETGDRAVQRVGPADT